MSNRLQPPIELVTDSHIYAKMLVESANSCSLFVKNFIGFDVFDYNRAFLDCMDRFIVYRCIEENEFIYCKDGIKKTSELTDGDEILGGTVKGIHSFEDELLEVKFANGTKIKVNGEHPFYTNRGWVNGRSLTTNDKVEFSSSQKFRQGVKPLGNDDIIKLMGYLFSDGSICSGREVRFVNTNKDLIDEVIQLSTKSFDINVNHRTEQYNNYKLTHRLRFISKIKSTKKNSNPLMKFIRDNDLMQSETFGKSILSLPREQLKHFINGYFNGDGCLLVSQGVRNQVHIKFSIGNKRQRAYEFQYMLWKLGIDSLVSTQSNKPLSTGTFYEVSICKSENVKKILQWLDRRKYPDKFKKAEEILGLITRHHKYNIFSKVKSITPCGTGKVVGFEINPTHEIYSYLGMKTHNTGRQVGKSTNAALKAIHFAYFAPLFAHNIDTGVANIVIASLSKDQAKLILSKIVEFIHMSPTLSKKILRETKTEITIEWYDGQGKTNFIVRPIGDAGDSLRGFTAHMAILDEAAYIPQTVYDAFLPSTVTTKPRIILASTPKGKNGQFHKSCMESHTIYEHGKPRAIEGNEDKKKNQWTQFHVTTLDNPLAASDPQVLKLIGGTTKAAERQEIYGEFLDAGTSLIPYNLLQESLIPVEQTKFDYYELGVDTSGKGQDETVLITIGVRGNKCYPVDIYTELTTEQPKLSRKIRDMNRIYGYRRIYIDETGIGDTLMDLCREFEDGLPIVGINFKSYKSEMYVNLERLFEERLINLSFLEPFSRDKLADQLSYMYWEYGKFKDQPPKVRTDHPDDYSDSCALGVFGQQKVDFFQVIPDDMWFS